MKLPFIKSKNPEDKDKNPKQPKEKKVKQPKEKKVKPTKGNKIKFPKLPNFKKSKKGEDKAKDNNQVEEEIEQGTKVRKKLSKKALIVTVLVLVLVIIIVVCAILFFPKKKKDDAVNPSASTSAEASGESSKASSGESSGDDSGDGSSGDGSSSEILLSPDGVPLIPDPDFNLKSVADSKAVIEAQFDTQKYKIDTLDEKIVIEGKTYAAFTLSENGEQVGPPIAVSREDGKYMCYYPEKVFSNFIDFPLIPADAAHYKWNGTFERVDENGKITSIITAKQLEENEMQFVISTYVGKESETITGKAKVRDHVAVFTDGDFFRIEFVKFADSVVITESGKNKHKINATYDGEYKIK